MREMLILKEILTTVHKFDYLICSTGTFHCWYHSTCLCLHVLSRQIVWSCALTARDVHCLFCRLHNFPSGATSDCLNEWVLNHSVNWLFQEQNKWLSLLVIISFTWPVHSKPQIFMIFKRSLSDKLLDQCSKLAQNKYK